MKPCDKSAAYLSRYHITIIFRFFKCHLAVILRTLDRHSI